MYQCFETVDLGIRTFTVNGRSLEAKLSLHVYPDDVPFDGDDAEDIAAFERGEFQMYVAEVRAAWNGLVESDFLGGIAAAGLQDIETVVAAHFMVSEALDTLAGRVADISKAIT